MKKASICLCVLVCFSASSFSSLVYENFESYVVGAEDSGGAGDLWLNWSPAMSGGHPAPGNAFLTPYVDAAVSSGGGKSMRLDAPLLVWDDNAGSIVQSTAGWGVIIRDDGATVDVSAYNVLTAMIKSSGIAACRIIVRDSASQEVGNDVISVPQDGDWHKITVILDGAGSKATVQRILPFFSGIASDATGPQMWLDEIQFELVKLAPELLEVQGAGGPVGGSTLYSFAMTEQPSEIVTFTLTPPAQLDLGAGFGEPIALDFSGANWDIPQQVEISIDPAAATGMVLITVSVSSVQPEYDQAVDGTFSFPILGPYGAFYVISPETPFWGSPSALQGDSGIQLVDGVIATYFYLPLDTNTWVQWAPNAYVPANPPYAEITFDLGQVKDVDNVAIYHLGLYYPPGSFDLSYSTDGVTYTDSQNYPAYLDGVVSKTQIVNEPAVEARYVKLLIRCIDDDPGNWFFVTEVEINVPIAEKTPPYYDIDSANIPKGPNPDPDEDKLLNGQMHYALSASGWVRFQDADATPYDHVILWANYGQKREFSNLILNYFSGWGVNQPDSVKLSFSDDGLTYGPEIVLADWYLGNDGGGRIDAKAFAPQRGQYVKLEFVRKPGDSPLILGNFILTNRKEVSYVHDPATPVWGGTTAASGDVALEPELSRIRMGDLTNNYIAQLIGPAQEPDWVQWAPSAVGPETPPYALITFNLGHLTMVKNVEITYLAWPNSGATVPGGLEAAFSTDGVNFSALTDVGAVFEDNTEQAEIFTTVFDLPDTGAQYVRLKIRCKDDNPNNWFFISEVKFNVFASDINDDGTVGAADLEWMAEEWLMTGDNLPADIAGDDATVDLLDFAVLGSEWLQ